MPRQFLQALKIISTPLADEYWTATHLPAASPLSNLSSPLHPSGHPRLSFRNDFEHELVHHRRPPREITLATNWAIARALRAMSRGESKLFVENHIIASAEIQCTRPRPPEFQFYTQTHFNARRAKPGGYDRRAIKNNWRRQRADVMGRRQPHGKLTRNSLRGKSTANLVRIRERRCKSL